MTTRTMHVVMYGGTPTVLKAAQIVKMIGHTNMVCAGYCVKRTLAQPHVGVSQV